ncbi:MAG: hypothetical protein EBY29_16930, partial [Planctomycetes bacterium]|nr:hypothetical protein [Planctomycetota bacterium]
SSNSDCSQNRIISESRLGFSSRKTDATFTGDAVLGTVTVAAPAAASTITFAGAGDSSLSNNGAAVTLGKITNNGTGTVTLKGAATWTSPLNFSNDGTIKLESGSLLQGAVTTAVDGAGTLQIAAINSSVTGNIGAGGLKLKKLEFFGGAGGNITPVTGEIHTSTTKFDTANNENYTFTAITNLGTVTTHNSGRTSTIDFKADGSLTADLGGTTIASIKASTAVSSVTIDGAWTTNLILGNAASIFKLGNEAVITGAVTTTAAGNGTLSFLGAGTVTGDVGNGNAIGTLSVGAGAANIGGTLNTADVAFTSPLGSLTITGAATITGAVTGGKGTLIFGAGGGSVAGAASLGAVKINAGNVTFNDTLTTTG